MLWRTSSVSTKLHTKKTWTSRGLMWASHGFLKKKNKYTGSLYYLNSSVGVVGQELEEKLCKSMPKLFYLPYWLAIRFSSTMSLPSHPGLTSKLKSLLNPKEMHSLGPTENSRISSDAVSTRSKVFLLCVPHAVARCRPPSPSWSSCKAGTRYNVWCKYCFRKRTASAFTARYTGLLRAHNEWKKAI